MTLICQWVLLVAYIVGFVLCVIPSKNKDNHAGQLVSAGVIVTLAVLTFLASGFDLLPGGP